MTNEQKERGLKMAYMALNTPVSKTGDIKQDLSKEKLEAFTKEICGSDPILATIPFIEVQS